MMKKVIAVVAAVLLLVAGPGLFQKVYNAKHGDGALERRIVYGPEQPQAETHSITIERRGAEVVLIDGDEETIVGDWTKTAIVDGAAHITGTITVKNQDEGFAISAPTLSAHVWYACARFKIEDITTSGWSGADPQPDPPVGTDATFVRQVRVESVDGAEIEELHDFVYFDQDDEGPWNVSMDYDLSVTGRELERREVATPNTSLRPDASGVCYSAELDDENQWQDTHPIIVSASCDVGSLEMEQEYDPDNPQSDPDGWYPWLAALPSINCMASQHKGSDGYEYVDISMAWDQVDFDFSRYHKDPIDGGNWKCEGQSDTLTWSMLQTNLSLNDTHTVNINRPYAIDLTDFGVWDRDWGLAADLCCSVPMQASNHLGASTGWATTTDGQTFGATVGDTVYPTVQDLRDVGEYIDPPSISGLDYRDPDDEHKLLTSTTFSATLTEASVEHYVEQYGHDPDDLKIGFLVPGVDASRMDAEPDYDAMVALAHASTYSWYGPSGDKAHTHESWTGSDGASSPSAAGVFEVSGGTDSTLTLEVDSNFESRLQQIPDQIFPTGMPGVPDMYNYHRAGLWRDYDGELDQNGDPWSEPAEGGYSGRGFSAVDLNLSGGAACTLTVTMQVATFTHTDNHYISSTRQEDYEFTKTTQTIEYEVDYDPTEADSKMYLAVPSNADTVGYDPDMEVLEQVTISGFADASDWTFADDPGWARDSVGTIPTIKLFEAPIVQYADGGHSAVVDSTCYSAMMDTAEDNKDHDNLVETRTLRLFDFVESEPPPDGPLVHVDGSGVYTAEQQCTRMTNCCNAWTATLDADVVSKMVDDVDDDGDTWGVVRAFNIRAPRDSSVPLEQRVGSLNGALVVGSVQLVQGAKTALRGWKIIGGSMHGQTVQGGELGRQDYAETIYRQPQGSDPEDWNAHDTPRSNSAGYWYADSGEIYQAFDPATVLWEYGQGNSSDDVTSTGRWATREYDYATLVQIILRNLHLSEDGFGPVYLVDASGSGVGLRMRRPGTGWESRIEVVSNTTQVAGGVIGPAGGPHIIRDTDADLKAHGAQSMSGAWLAQVALESGYTWPDPGYAWSRYWITAYKDGQQHILRRRRTADFDAVDVRAIAASADKPASLLVNTRLSRLLCAIETTGGDTTIYGSPDLGATWSEIVTVADYTWPRIVARDGFLWLMGVVGDDDTVKVQRRQLASSALTTVPFYEGDTEATVSATSSGQRPAFHAMRTLGDLLAVVQDADGALQEIRSYDHGNSWTETVTIT